MIKNLTIIYSSIMFVMLFAVMILLIGVTLLQANSNQNFIVASNLVTPNEIGLIEKNDDEGIKNSATQNSEDSLQIETDKSFYTVEEKIIISFENKGELRMDQKGNSNLTVKLRSSVGKNFEIAFIEQLTGDEWVAIEPVKRCSEKCNEPCAVTSQLHPNNVEKISWSQTLVDCSEESRPQITRVTPGSYRIISAVWNKKNSDFEKVYSNIFKISDISRK